MPPKKRKKSTNAPASSKRARSGASAAAEGAAVLTRSGSNPRTPPHYTQKLKMSESDQNKLKMPFVGQWLSFEVFLVATENKDDKLVANAPMDLGVSICYDDDKELVGEDAGESAIEVKGAKIDKKGTAHMQIKFKSLSKNHDNKKFQLNVAPFRESDDDDRFNHVAPCTSPPVFVVSHHIKIATEAPKLWYKDQGGRDKTIDFAVQLVDANGVDEQREVPLDISLHYDTDGRPEAPKVCHKSGMDILVMSKETDPTIRKGTCMVHLRINDVSKNHTSYPFLVRIGPNTRKNPQLNDVAAAYSTPIIVRSKKNRKSKAKANASAKAAAPAATYSGVLPPANSNAPSPLSSLLKLSHQRRTELQNRTLEPQAAVALLVHSQIALQRWIQNSQRQMQQLAQELAQVHQFNTTTAIPLLELLMQHFDGGGNGGGASASAAAKGTGAKGKAQKKSTAKRGRNKTGKTATNKGGSVMSPERNGAEALIGLTTQSGAAAAALAAAGGQASFKSFPTTDVPSIPQISGQMSRGFTDEMLRSLSKPGSWGAPTGGAGMDREDSFRMHMQRFPSIPSYVGASFQAGSGSFERSNSTGQVDMPAFILNESLKDFGQPVYSQSGRLVGFKNGNTFVSSVSRQISDHNRIQMEDLFMKRSSTGGVSRLDSAGASSSPGFWTMTSQLS